MKQHYKKLITAILGIALSAANAQVSGYIFAQSNGTYTPITGGTVIATATANASPGNLAATVWNLPAGTFPFAFMFNGIAYTGCNISCNGYITFGVTPPLTTAGSPINNTTAYDGAISAWGRTNNGVYNLGSGPFYTSELRIEVLGAAPNRTIVIQYDNWRYSSGSTTTTWIEDFQIRLVETTNVVEIVYGPGVMVGGSLTTSGFNCQVGLRGAANSDYNNRSSYGLFNASTTGTINNASQVIGVSSGVGIFMPPDGLTYRWYPPCSTGSPLTPSITAISTVICEGDTLNFAATGETPFIDMTYQWQLSTSPGGPYSNVSGPPPGTVFASYKKAGAPGIFYYVLLSTCPTSSAFAISNEIQVDVRPLPVIGITSNPALNTSVSPIQACFGETYTLTASGASTYSWASGPATATFAVQPTGNMVYMVTGVSVDGCISSRTVNIFANPRPTISILASPASSVCPGTAVVIGVSGSAVTYTWTNPVSNAFLITVTPTASATYTVRGTAATGCTNVATHQVAVFNTAPMVPSVSGSGTICKGEKANLSATGALSYTWLAAGTFTTGQQVALSPEITTTYSVTGIDANGCVSQGTVTQIVQACTGIDGSTGALSAVVYPNPASSNIFVKVGNGALKTFDVMDLTGKIVLSASTAEDIAQLDISTLANGIYHLRIQLGQAVQMVKIVKE